MSSQGILNLGKLHRGKIVRRPATGFRTPYIADVVLDGTKETIQAHCSVFLPNNIEVMMTKVPDEIVEKRKRKTTHSIELLKRTPDWFYLASESEEPHEWGSANCDHGNKLIKRALECGRIPFFGEIQDLQQEVTIGDSRFDFMFQEVEKENPTIIEVKFACFTRRNSKEGSTSAVFGWRIDGDKGERLAPTSDRFLKHAKSLGNLTDEYNTYFIYVCGWPDADYFKLPDPKLNEAMKQAKKAGVHVHCLSFKWLGSECFYDKEIPIRFEEEKPSRSSTKQIKDLEVDLAKFAFEPKEEEAVSLRRSGKKRKLKSSSEEAQADDEVQEEETIESTKLRKSKRLKRKSQKESKRISLESQE